MKLNLSIILFFAFNLSSYNLVAQALTVQLTANYANNSAAVCFGENAGNVLCISTGGVAPYSFLWSNGVTVQNIYNVPSGYYRVHVSDANGNEIDAEITLSQYEMLTALPIAFTYNNGYNLSCYGCTNGSITMTVYGGAPPYFYLWSDGNTNQNRTSLDVGAYYCTITDDAGCTMVTEHIYLTEPERSDWTITGNNGSNPGVNFIGTKDNKDLVFKTNNVEQIRIGSNAKIKLKSFENVSSQILYADSAGVLNGFAFVPPPALKLPPPIPCNASLPVTFAWTQVPGNGNQNLCNCWQQFGFGTDNPQDRLHVIGTGRFSNWNDASHYTTITHDGAHGVIETTDFGLMLNYYSKQDVITGNDLKVGGNLQQYGSDFKLGLVDNRDQGLNPNQRALVHSDGGDKLIINFGYDFEGGCEFHALDGAAAFRVIDLSGNQYKTNILATGDGTFYARRVKVNLDTNWPDYVFNDEYKKLTIKELEEFINANKHLPGIPKASDVAKDGNIDIGDMQIKLLEKVEELTLYIIELQKQNEVFKLQIESLKK